MRGQIRDYPAGPNDDLTDAVNPFSVKRPGWPRALYKTANWLLSIITLTVIPVALGYVAMRMIRFMVAPATSISFLVWYAALWALGFVTLAALVMAIAGAIALIQTTHKS